MVFDKNRVLMNVKLCLARLAQQRSRHLSNIPTIQLEAVNDLRHSQPETAFRRVNGIMKLLLEIQTMDACDGALKTLAPNLELVASCPAKRGPPSELLGVLSTILYTTDKLVTELGANQPELVNIVEALVGKFGYPALSQSVPENVTSSYNSAAAPNPNAVNAHLAELARSACIEFTPFVPKSLAETAFVSPPPPPLPSSPSPSVSPALTATVSGASSLSVSVSPVMTDSSVSVNNTATGTISAGKLVKSQSLTTPSKTLNFLHCPHTSSPSAREQQLQLQLQLQQQQQQQQQKQQQQQATTPKTIVASPVMLSTSPSLMTVTTSNSSSSSSYSSASSPSSLTSTNTMGPSAATSESSVSLPITSSSAGSLVGAEGGGLVNKTGRSASHPPRVKSFLDLFKKFSLESVVSSGSSSTGSTSPPASSSSEQEKEKSEKKESSAPLTPLDLASFPLAIETSDPSNDPGTLLSFGLGSRQAPVCEELADSFVIANRTKEKWNFKVCWKPENEALLAKKVQVRLSGAEGHLHSLKGAVVGVSLAFACTTRAKIILQVSATKDGDKTGSSTESTELITDLESQLTTRLDSDELKKVDEIGSGAYGTVYRGEYRGFGVAIKVIKNQDDLMQQMLEDFKSEVAVMEKLRHPCILTFVGAVHDPGNLAIVTELAPYGNLWNLMQKRKLPVEFKMKCLVDCASGMDFLHQSGILHRDLKPDNLLIVSLEARSSVACKLSDFGTTRDVNRHAAEMKTTKGIGTPLYMAPEVLDGEVYDRSADVYSFSLIIYVVFAETLPFSDMECIGHPWEFAAAIRKGRRPTVNTEWPQPIREMMQSCWDAAPSARPSFNQLHIQLSQLLERMLPPL